MLWIKLIKNFFFLLRNVAKIKIFQALKPATNEVRMKKFFGVLLLSLISVSAFAVPKSCIIPKIYCYDDKGNEIIYPNIGGTLDSAGNCITSFLCPGGGSALTTPRTKVKKMLASPRTNTGL